MASIFHKQDAVTRILITHGVDTRERYPSLYHDCTVLHMAAALGSAAIVELLLKRGLDIEARDSWLQTPLHWAMKTLRGKIGSRDEDWTRTVGVLVRNRADTEAADIRGRTPRSVATPLQNETIDRLLRGQRGARIALGELRMCNGQATAGRRQGKRKGFGKA
jgi:hypothetical protein